jgi:hypothetical protein
VDSRGRRRIISQFLIRGFTVRKHELLVSVTVPALERDRRAERTAERVAALRGEGIEAYTFDGAHADTGLEQALPEGRDDRRLDSAAGSIAPGPRSIACRPSSERRGACNGSSTIRPLVVAPTETTTITTHYSVILADLRGFELNALRVRRHG